MSKYDKERTEAAKRFSNMIRDRGFYPSVKSNTSPVTGTHHVYDRDAQSAWTRQDIELQLQAGADTTDWEDKRADEFPDAVFYTCMVVALLYFCYELFSGIADWMVGL